MTSYQENVEPLRKQTACPNCEKPSARSFYPFCSKRCNDLDLGKWLTGAFAIPVEEEDAGIESDELDQL